MQEEHKGKETDYPQMKKPPSGFTKEATLHRQKWIQEVHGIDVAAQGRVDPLELQGIIEYHAGYMEIPMAVASPLNVHGTYAKGSFMVPLCTLEGALVMSMCRGMLATSLCGGVRTSHVRQELSRSPAFLVDKLSHAKQFVHWVEEHFDEIKEVAESTTRYGTLLRIKPIFLHRWVVLDMIYDTGNAAGQNMVTIASHVACRYIEKQTGRHYILESGFNSDKKPSHKNLVEGRGHYVIAEASLSKKVLRRVLHISMEDAYLLQRVSLPVAHVTGSIGSNLNISNSLAAIYLATGQDVACVAENSVGHTQIILADDKLHLHVTMPSMTVGTVGGGTRLPMQQKNLRMLGCAEGEHSAKKFAEIICAAALTLELSLLSAISSDTFADAHKQYGREKQRNG